MQHATDAFQKSNVMHALDNQKHQAVGGKPSPEEEGDWSWFMTTSKAVLDGRPVSNRPESS